MLVSDCNKKISIARIGVTQSITQSATRNPGKSHDNSTFTAISIRPIYTTSGGGRIPPSGAGCQQVSRLGISNSFLRS